MITYCDVLKAFLIYAAGRKQGDWNDLWILAQRRMEALVKTKARLLSVPLDTGEIDGIITDATTRVMDKLRTASDVDEKTISATFWYEFKTTARDYNRSMEKWSRMKKAARLMGLKYFTNFIKPTP